MLTNGPISINHIFQHLTHSPLCLRDSGTHPLTASTQRQEINCWKNGSRSTKGCDDNVSDRDYALKLVAWVWCVGCGGVGWGGVGSDGWSVGLGGKDESRWPVYFNCIHLNHVPSAPGKTKLASPVFPQNWNTTSQATNLWIITANIMLYDKLQLYIFFPTCFHTHTPSLNLFIMQYVFHLHSPFK